MEIREGCFFRLFILALNCVTFLHVSLHMIKLPVEKGRNINSSPLSTFFIQGNGTQSYFLIFQLGKG